MSHFTSIRTGLQNIVYLKKALRELKINHRQYDKMEYKTENVHLVIPQLNGYGFMLCWNGKEYELLGEMTLWRQRDPVEVSIDKLKQAYMGALIIGESQKRGYKAVEYKKNKDGSLTIVLERWD